ncbi:Ca2+-binding RTX toxin-like protein [Bradyrhizobium sp. LB7.2]
MVPSISSSPRSRDTERTIATQDRTYPLSFNPTALIGPSGNIGYDWEAASLSQVQLTISGTSGSDLLTDGAGYQLLQGGLGDDGYYIHSARDLVWEASNAGYDRIFTATSYAVSSNTDIEYLATADRTGLDPIALTGNHYTEVMAGNYGDNVFFSGDGAQNMFGYLGNDTYYVDTKLDSVNEYFGQGYDRAYTTVTYALPYSTEVEELAVTAASSDTPVNLYGNLISNVLTGNAGNNLLDGRGGGDKLIGLGGNDSYMINNSSDVVIEAAGQGTDTVFSAISYMLNGGAYVEVLRVATSVSASTPITLIGNGLVGLLVGHAGDDELNAQGAPGTKLVGGLGNDIYYVHAAADQITEAAGQGFDTVKVSTSYTLGYGVEVERLGTSHANLTYAFTLTGNAFAQTIVGNAGNNLLNGKDGNDVLTGGAGSDTFVFDTAPGANNVDGITDFASGEDVIQLSGSRFPNIGLGVLDNVHFAFGATATDTLDRILYDSNTGDLYYDRDGTGGITPVHFATLTPHTALAAHDFLII